MKISDLLLKSAGRPFYSLEFFPPRETAQLPEFFSVTERLRELEPLFVSVTFGAGGSRRSDTLEVASGLKERCGFEPMTHLTCVASRRADIKDYLGRLAELGIDNILALRGDAPGARDPSAPPYAWESGDFQHASDLVAFIREEFPGFCIGVAGYPSPHPESLSLEQDRLYTAAKIRAGGDFLVTQLFFDPREYLDLVRDLRVLGVDKPVLPGVMPVQSLESLRRVLALCGAVIPPDYQRELEKANRLGGSEAVRKLGVEYAAGQVRALVAEGAPGVHLYTLNNADSCLKIATLAGF